MKRIFKTTKKYRDMTTEELRLWKNKLQTDYNNSEKGKQTRAAYRASGRLAISEKKHDLKRHYGLTPETWEAMFERQGRRCAVCGSTDPGRKSGEWCTDHDHNKGRGHARAIVCLHCNFIMGYAKDSIPRLQMVIGFLERINDRA
jgi:Recombination endonuclease VII